MIQKRGRNARRIVETIIVEKKLPKSRLVFVSVIFIK